MFMISAASLNYLLGVARGFLKKYLLLSPSSPSLSVTYLEAEVEAELLAVSILLKQVGPSGRAPGELAHFKPDGGYAGDGGQRHGSSSGRGDRGEGRSVAERVAADGGAVNVRSAAAVAAAVLVLVGGGDRKGADARDLVQGGVTVTVHIREVSLQLKQLNCGLISVFLFLCWFLFLCFRISPDSMPVCVYSQTTALAPLSY